MFIETLDQGPPRLFLEIDGLDDHILRELMTLPDNVVLVCKVILRRSEPPETEKLWGFYVKKKDNPDSEVKILGRRCLDTEPNPEKTTDKKWMKEVLLHEAEEIARIASRAKEVLLELLIYRTQIA